MFIAFASFRFETSVQVSGVRLPARLAADRAGRGLRVAPQVESGSRRSRGAASPSTCAQLSLVFSMSTRGSSMIPFWMPSSQWSNQAWSWRIHSARLVMNGSMWPSRQSHSLRGTLLAASWYHHSVVWSGSTLSSCRQCVAKTEALTLSAFGR